MTVSPTVAVVRPGINRKGHATERVTRMIIRPAAEADSPDIAAMVGELLTEIMSAVQEQAFHFDLSATIDRLMEFIRQERYFVFVACDGASLIGFITLCESHSLYAEGTFGTIPELYVRPRYRSRGVGFDLLERAKAFGRSRRWTRLEATTPPLPQFDKTLSFYQREGFEISGGRKLKALI